MTKYNKGDLNKFINKLKKDGIKVEKYGAGYLIKSNDESRSINVYQGTYGKRCTVGTPGESVVYKFEFGKDYYADVVSDWDQLKNELSNINK